MTDETQNGSHGSFEPRDIGTKGVIYFLLGLAAVTLLVHFLLAGVYDFLDKRERADQPAMNPLVTNVPEDTRKVAPKYPEKAFPDPRLETDERTQLDEIRLGEEEKLNSYGWVDEKAGTVHIPIEQAMDLLVQRGLPVHAQGTVASASAASPATKAPEKTSSKNSGKK